MFDAILMNGHLLVKALPGRITKKGERKERVVTEGAHNVPPKQFRETGETSKWDYGDPHNFKYPMGTETHVRAAVRDFSKPKNYLVYPVKERVSVWKRIRRIATKEWGMVVDRLSGPPEARKKS